MLTQRARKAAVMLVLVACGADLLSAQDPPTPLDSVVTVVSRAAERSTGDSPVPVDVVSYSMLESTGLLETWQQLQRLVPSVNVPHIPIGDNHMRPVTLRGLEPHHVLVLVNGRRHHPAATLLAGPSVPFASFTDIGSIPFSAIERIEVLRDGAAAQYGSDAIGGVVNIVLRRGIQHDFRLSAGSTYTSEHGRRFQDGESLNAGGVAGFESADGAYLTIAAELGGRNGTNRAYPDTRPQYFEGDPRNELAPRVSGYSGNGAVREFKGLISASRPLGAGIEAHAAVGGARRAGESYDAFFRRPLDPATVRALHPDGFIPELGREVDDLFARAGLRGSLHGWGWEVSSGWGGNGVSYTVRNSNNPSLGANGPTAFRAGRVATRLWTTNADVVGEVRVGSGVIGLAGGAELRTERYTITAGEPDAWRDGGVPVLDGPDAGRPAAAGAQGMVGYRPLDEVNAQRTGIALYLEAEGRPVTRLLLQSAVRLENHSDLASTADGRLAARAELARGIAVRGSIGTGFRAPPLAQQHFASSRSVYMVVDGVTRVVTVRTFPATTPEARLMGATPLRPEQSVNASAGFVLRIPRLPLLTVDVYQIDIDDRISLAASVSDTSLVRMFDENGMRGIGGGNFFTNRQDTRTRGVDIVASHSLRMGSSGLLHLSGGYNHTRSRVMAVRTPPEQIAKFESAWFNRTSRGIIEQGQPRETVALSAQYSTGRWAFNLHGQRSGPTAQLDPTRPESDQVLRAKWIADARASYSFGSRMELAVNIANIFDSYPDEWWDFKDGLEATGPSLRGIFRYPGALSPFGMNGRSVSVQLSYR